MKTGIAGLITDFASSTIRTRQPIILITMA